MEHVLYSRPPRQATSSSSRQSSCASSCCRICRDPAPTSELISPCGCKGSLQNVHTRCLRRWLTSSSKFSNIRFPKSYGSFCPKDAKATVNSPLLKCEICWQPYRIHVSPMSWRGLFKYLQTELWARSPKELCLHVTSYVRDNARQCARGLAQASYSIIILYNIFQFIRWCQPTTFLSWRLSNFFSREHWTQLVVFALAMALGRQHCKYLAQLARFWWARLSQFRRSQWTITCPESHGEVLSELPDTSLIFHGTVGDHGM